MKAFSLFFSFTLVGFLLLQSCSSPTTKIKRTPSSGDQKIIFFLLDGTNEKIFSEMMDKGELPHFQKLKDGTLIPSHKGLYSPATSVWPSTTGPGYAPFLMGVYPNKSGLSGIRQFLREQGIFRSYPGSDIQKINDDLAKDYATIYELFEDDETYNQQGFITRRGWKKNGEALTPKIQNLTSFTGLVNKGIFFGKAKSHEGNDLRNIQTFLAHVSPKIDTNLASYKAFNSLDECIVEGRGCKATMSFTDFLERSLFQGKGLGHLPPFSFIGLHAPDAVSHEGGVGEKYRESLRKVDLMIAGVVKYFTLRGEIDNITFIFSADHGTDSVREGKEFHAPIISRLSKDTGLPLQDAIKRITAGFKDKWKKKSGEFAGISAVSGNANVQIYLKGDCNGCKTNPFKLRTNHESAKNYKFAGNKKPPVDVIKTLASYPEVAQVFSKDLENSFFYITSSIGEAKIEFKEKLYRYEILKGSDPLELNQAMAKEMIKSGEFHSGDDWAAATKDSNYPDSIVQIVQLLMAPNSGDIIFDAKAGYEPWDEMQNGLHGALRRDHMLVPLLISSPVMDKEKAEAVISDLGRYPRTVDVYPTMLNFFGKPLPAEIVFKRKKMINILSKETIKAPVKTDIDGVSLDIWKD